MQGLGEAGAAGAEWGVGPCCDACSVSRVFTGALALLPPSALHNRCDALKALDISGRQGLVKHGQRVHQLAHFIRARHCANGPLLAQGHGHLGSAAAACVDEGCCPAHQAQCALGPLC